MNLSIILVIYLVTFVSTLASETQSMNAVEEDEYINVTAIEETKNFTEIL